MQVSVGYLKFHVGHMDYVGDNTKYIIIGVVVGAVVLIALIACFDFQGKK